jgi:hypothetical protein
MAKLYLFYAYASLDNPTFSNVKINLATFYNYPTFTAEREAI